MTTTFAHASPIPAFGTAPAGASAQAALRPEWSIRAGAALHRRAGRRLGRAELDQACRAGARRLLRFQWVDAVVTFAVIAWFAVGARRDGRRLARRPVDLGYAGRGQVGNARRAATSFDEPGEFGARENAVDLKRQGRSRGWWFESCRARQRHAKCPG